MTQEEMDALMAGGVDSAEETQGETAGHAQKELSGGYRLTLRGSHKVLNVSRNYGHLFKQM